MPKRTITCVETSIQKEILLSMQIARHEDFTSISDIRAVLFLGTKTIGLFEGQVVHFSESPGDDLLYEMDGHSQELLECYSDLFDVASEFSEAEAIILGDLLNLKLIEIDKAFRRKGLGLEVLASVLGFFAGPCDFAIMKPFPLQWSGWLGDDATPAQRAAFTKQQLKLIRYYSPLGFEKIPGTQERYYRRLQAGEEILGRSREQWRRSKHLRLPYVDEFEPRGLEHPPPEVKQGERNSDDRNVTDREQEGR